MKKQEKLTEHEVNQKIEDFKLTIKDSPVYYQLFLEFMGLLAFIARDNRLKIILPKMLESIWHDILEQNLQGMLTNPTIMSQLFDDADIDDFFIHLNSTKND